MNMKEKNVCKGMLVIFTIIIMTMGMLSHGAGLAHSETTITILVENDCPYSCRPENGQPGFIQDILKTIYEKNGFKTSFHIFPWLRVLNSFNDQNPGVDCMIGMKVHPVNKEIALFPEEEIARYTHRFYALKDSPLTKTWEYQGLESLKNMKVGCVKGWSYCNNDVTKYLTEGDDPQVQAMTGEDAEEKNFRKLVAGRIDLWISNINNTEYMLAVKRNSGNKEVDKIVGIADLPVTAEVNVYPIFYKNMKGEKYSEIYVKGIRELRETGELNSIMAKYGLTDWKKE